MRGFMKLAATVVSVFVLGGTPSARGDAVLVPLDGSNKAVKPADFGYKIDIFAVNPRAILQIVLTEDAAKSFARGWLTLTKDGQTVVAATLGLDEAGDKKGLLKITLDTQVVDGGELVIWSRAIKAQPLVNFGGFRLSIKRLLAQAKEAEGNNRQPKKLQPMYVIASADLYEVDDAFYKKLAKARWLTKADLEEEERKWLNAPKEKQPDDSLFVLLKKQKRGVRTLSRSRCLMNLDSCPRIPLESSSSRGWKKDGENAVGRVISIWRFCGAKAGNKRPAQLRCHTDRRRVGRFRRLPLLGKDR